MLLVLVCSAVKAAAKAAGAFGCTISGAGPTCVAVTADKVQSRSFKTSAADHHVSTFQCATFQPATSDHTQLLPVPPLGQRISHDAARKAQRLNRLNGCA